MNPHSPKRELHGPMAGMEIKLGDPDHGWRESCGMDSAARPGQVAVERSCSGRPGNFGDDFKNGIMSAALVSQAALTTAIRGMRTILQVSNWRLPQHVGKGTAISEPREQ